MIVSFFIADGLLRTFYEYFGGQAVGSDRLFADSLGSEITGSIGTAIVFFLVVVPVCRRWPITRQGLGRRLAVHLVALLAFSIAKTFLMWALRIPLWPLLGLGSYDYGNLLYRFPMEGAGDVLGYAMLAAAVHAWEGWKRLKRQEVEAARLESQLTSARLDALRDRLQPHFLFNTLNTIGSLVHDAPETADRMITRLSDLLRRALESPPSELVTVEEEIALITEYTDIMLARFGDRAQVHIEVDGKVRGALLPPFVVQPLVENAFKHGIEPRAEPGVVSISVTRNHSALEVRVEDEGSGLAASSTSSGTGIGLANVQDRLSLLFGDEGSLTVQDRDDGGVTAMIRVPLRFKHHTEAPPRRATAS